MSNLLKVSDEIQQQMLSDLCARNHTCELVCNSSEGKRIRAKVRFLNLSGRRILIDLPMVSGRAVMIRPGEIIQLYFLWKGQRFVATSIIQARKRFQEGKSKALDALAIQYPYEIERAQRRECYRLSLTHLPKTTITIGWAKDLNDSEPPKAFWAKPPAKKSLQQQEESSEDASEKSKVTDAKADEEEGPRQLNELPGRMINLSETGCLAVFNKKSAPRFEHDHLYYATFSLSDDGEPFEMTVEIRWSQDHPAGDRVMAGMSWRLEPNNREHRAIQTRIGKFITEEQREALRRARDE